MDEQQLDLGEDQKDFEFTDENNQHNPDDDYFDEVVGTLQQIVISVDFENVQKAFMQKHCQIFEEGQENKIEYMTIFKNYQNEIEKYLEKVLSQRISKFSMEKFNQLLSTRTDQIDEQLLDMLLSFSEFSQFKILMIDYKNYYEEQERIKLLTIKTNKVPQTKKVKGASNIFNSNTGFQFEKSPQAMIQQLKKQHTKKKPVANLNIKQDEKGGFQPDLLLTIQPLRKK